MVDDGTSWMDGRFFEQETTEGAMRVLWEWIERRHGVLQDRLVKELRLRGIKDLEAANEFLAGKFLENVNGQFGHSAARSLSWLVDVSTAAACCYEKDGPWSSMSCPSDPRGFSRNHRPPGRRRFRGGGRLRTIPGKDP
jgi:hypothetical protein